MPTDKPLDWVSEWRKTCIGARRLGQGPLAVDRHALVARFDSIETCPKMGPAGVKRVRNHMEQTREDLHHALANAAWGSPVFDGVDERGKLDGYLIRGVANRISFLMIRAGTRSRLVAYGCDSDRWIEPFEGVES